MTASRFLTRPRLIAGGCGALLLLLGMWCARTPAIPVESALVRRAPLRVEVNTNGTVEPLPDAELRVHARLEGRIVEIPEPGTRVEAGDVVLQLDAVPVASALAAAESERLAAEEALRTARSSHELIERRAATDQELFAQGALTAQRRAETQAQLEEATERLRNLEREVPLRLGSLDLHVAELKEQLEATRVVAPFAGTVYRTEFKKGEIVRVGDPILWLANLASLRVRANVDQVDLGRVRVGQRVEISSNAYPDRSWSATIAELVPHVVVKENRSVSEGLALVEPPTDGLVPGMTVDVDIVVAEVPDALQVPASAVHNADGIAYVYRVAGGRVQQTPVVLGRASVNAVEILSGLEPEAQVVLGTSNGLSDGSRVEARLQDVAAR